MICAETGCGGRLKVTHTYTMYQWKFQRASCVNCGETYCVTSEASRVERRGDGAKAKATAMEKGQ